MKKTIEIILAPSGEIVINALGFAGPDCERATHAMEEALGVAAGRTRKPEFHARPTVHQQQKVGS